MKTVGELRDALKDLNPDTEVELHSDSHHSGDVEIHIDKRRCCDGPYLVCELHQFEKDQ